MTMKACIRMLTAALLCLLLAPCPAAAAQAPYRGYEYDFYGVSREAPNIFLPVDAKLGDGTLRAPADMFAGDDGLLYVADTGNDRVVVLDAQFAVVRVVERAVLSGEETPLRAPEGVYVKDGLLYVCDTGNSRVLALDGAGNAVLCLDSVDPGMTTTAFQFLPVCVCVDSLGTVYVLSRNNYEGMLMFSSQGEFQGFFGADNVDMTLSLAIERLWRLIMTDVQRQKTQRVIPTPYTALFIDKSDFIYACVDRDSASAIRLELRRVNAKGGNVYGDKDYGDLEAAYVNGTYSDTTFRDVLWHDGMVYALDSARGRIFCYDEEGGMIGAFGALGTQLGSQKTPVAIAAFGGCLLSLDSATGAVTRYAPTPYGELLMEGARLYLDGLYQEAGTRYEAALLYHQNSEQAYARLGRVREKLGDYQGAMTYYRLGEDRTLYSQAFRLYRRQWLGERFTVIMLGALACAGACVVLARLRKRRRPERAARRGVVRQMLYTALHPVRGYEEMKFEGAGSAWVAGAIAVLYYAARVVSLLFSGFIVNTTNVEAFSPLALLAATTVPICLYAVVNWAVCTLIDGKGRFREIFISVSYAFAPLIAYEIVYTLLSHALLVEELVFLRMLGVVSVLHTGVMLYQAARVIHAFSGWKTVGALLFTAFGLAVVALLAVMVYTLFEQMSVFFRTIYNELLLRFS